MDWTKAKTKLRKLLTYLCDILYFVGLRAGPAILIRLALMTRAKRLLLSNGLFRFFFKRTWVGLSDRWTYVPKDLEYEHEVARFCNIEEDKCFLDVGANVGVYTLRLARKGIPVHAFEPSPHIFKMLSKNTKGIPNVTAYPYALSNKNGAVEFYLGITDYIPNQFFTTYKPYSECSCVKVQTKTVDSLKIKNVGLVKVDVEGHESQVLEGAFQTLKAQKPIVVVEVHGPIWKNDIRCMNVLRGANYTNIQRVWAKHHRKYFIVANN